MLQDGGHEVAKKRVLEHQVPKNDPEGSVGRGTCGIWDELGMLWGTRACDTSDATWADTHTHTHAHWPMCHRVTSPLDLQEWGSRHRDCWR